MLSFKNIEKFLDECKQMQTQHTKVLSSTLTSLAFEVRQEVRKELPNWVSLTRQFLPNSVIYKPATPETMLAKVGFLPRADFVHLLEEGGTRTPKESQNLAVPVEAKRTSKGAISAANRPRAVLQRKDTFIMTTDEGTSGIWKSLRNDIQLLYVFKKYTTYRDPKTKFYETAERIIETKTPEVYAKNFNRIINRV